MRNCLIASASGRFSLPSLWSQTTSRHSIERSPPSGKPDRPFLYTKRSRTLARFVPKRWDCVRSPLAVSQNSGSAPDTNEETREPGPLYSSCSQYMADSDHRNP